MSEYIEDRITSLENRVGDIERHYNFLNTRVNNLVDDVYDNADGITLLRGDLGKMGKEIDRLRCEVRGTEYLDPLTGKPTDQSTEEFVRVKHGEWRRVGARVDWVECTSCGYRLDVEPYTYPNTNYCPNCGAKMDLKDGE